MDFDLSNQAKVICEKVKTLFDEDSRASLGALKNRDTNLMRNLTKKWMKVFGQTGYLAIGLDNGTKDVDLVAAQENLATISPSLFLAVEVTTRIFGRVIAAYGSVEQKNEFLSALREGKFIGAVALSEESMNIESNPFFTSGLEVGGRFLVNGHKSHVVNGPLADWIAVAGKCGEGYAFFLVGKDSEGLAIGKNLCTLGFNGTVCSNISFENNSVPIKHVVGPFQDRKPFMTVRAWEDQILTAASLGLMRRSYETALKYAKEHKSGDRPIIEYQEVGFKLAEMLTLLQTSQLLAHRAAWMAKIEDGEADVLARCAKIFCSESAEAVASSGLQILGVSGCLSGNPVEEAYRDAKYLQIAGTSTEISRMKLGDGIMGWD